MQNKHVYCLWYKQWVSVAHHMFGSNGDGFFTFDVTVLTNVNNMTLKNTTGNQHTTVREIYHH